MWNARDNQPTYGQMQQINAKNGSYHFVCQKVTHDSLKRMLTGIVLT